MSLGNAVNKSHDAACRQHMASLLCQPSEVQEKPEERATPARQLWQTRIQLPARDKQRLARSKTARWRMGTETKRARTVAESVIVRAG